MDQTHDHGLLIKKVSKFLVSVFVCCFCFSQASLLSLLQSINLYLSTFPYKLFTHTMDKNSIFLIFNLLLVVLAKYSGLIRSLSWSSTCYRISDEASFNNINTEGGFRVESSMLRQEDQEAMASSSTTDNVSNAGEQKEREFLINQVEQDADNAVEEHKEEEHAVEEYKEEEHDEPEGRFIIEEEEENTGIFAEEDVEAGNEMLMSSTSTEELNKKFEDFIRRMKEELRIEAQRQPIMV